MSGLTNWHDRAGATWGPDDRSEYDDLMRQAWGDKGESPEYRKDVFLGGIEDGVQAHRLWARDAERELRRRGAWQMLTSWKKSQPRPVQINHDGRIYIKSPVIGVRRIGATGKAVDQQELFHLCTFDELREKLGAYMTAVAAYERNIHMTVRLLSLEYLAEGADGSWTPLRACEVLGVTVEDYLLNNGGAIAA